MRLFSSFPFPLAPRPPSRWPRGRAADVAPHVRSATLPPCQRLRVPTGAGGTPLAPQHFSSDVSNPRTLPQAIPTCCPPPGRRLSTHNTPTRTLFMRTLPFSTVSSARTMQMVSLDFFPLIMTVSPRKSESSFILSLLSDTTELSSFVASSTTRRFGLRPRRRPSPGPAGAGAAGSGFTSASLLWGGEEGGGVYGSQSGARKTGVALGSGKGALETGSGHYGRYAFGARARGASWCGWEGWVAHPSLIVRYSKEQRRPREKYI